MPPQKEKSPAMKNHYDALNIAFKNIGIDHLQSPRIMNLIQKILDARVSEIENDENNDEKLSQVDKHYKSLSSALAHAGANNLQKLRVLGIVNRIDQTNIDEYIEAKKKPVEITEDKYNKIVNHLNRERDLISNAIGGGSEMFMKLDDDFVLDPMFVANYIRSRRQDFSNTTLKHMKEKQDFEKRIKELEEELLEYKGSPKP